MLGFFKNLIIGVTVFFSSLNPFSHHFQSVTYTQPVTKLEASASASPSSIAIKIVQKKQVKPQKEIIVANTPLPTSTPTPADTSLTTTQTIVVPVPVVIPTPPAQTNNDNQILGAQAIIQQGEQASRLQLAQQCNPILSEQSTLDPQITSLQNQINSLYVTMLTKARGSSIAVSADRFAEAYQIKNLELQGQLNSLISQLNELRIEHPECF